MSEPVILDPTCSARSIWFNKHEPHTLYCDQRTVERTKLWSRPDGTRTRYIEIKPDIQCDFTALPFPDETFWHVVFDPPHMTHAGETSYMYMKYGKLDKNTWQKVLHDGFEECWRVLKTNGTLIFKWNECHLPIDKVLNAIGHEPLYGHHSGKKSNTHWLAFVKFTEGTE